MTPLAARALVAAAVASALQSCVASGGDACPYDEPGCRDHDDDSLLQVASRRRPAVLDVSEDAGVRGSVCPQVGGRVWLSTKALDFIMENVFPFAIDEIETPALPVDPIFGEYAGTRYVLDSMQLHGISAQAADLELVDGQGIQLGLSGLAARVAMRYNLSSSGLFGFAAEGTVSVSIGEGTSASVFIGFGADGAGNPKTVPQNVSVQIKISDMDFRGADPSLTAVINALSGVLRPLIEQQAQAAVVKAVNEYFSADVNSLMAGLDLGTPRRGDRPEPWDVAMKVCSVQITCCFIVADFYAAVEGANIYPPSPKNLLPTSTESMASSMFGATVAEWTVQGALWYVQKSGLMNASFGSPEVPTSAGDGLSFSDYTALDMNVTATVSFDFIDSGFDAKLEAQLELVQAGDDSAAVSVVTPVSTAARYADGQVSLQISADGEPRDLRIGQGAPASFQGQDASFLSSLLVDAANKNVGHFVEELVGMTSDGSTGLEIKDHELHFTGDDATALVNAVEVDIQKFFESFLGADLASHLRSGR